MDFYTNVDENYGLHSLYLWLLVETGLVGLLIFSLYVFLVLVNAKHKNVFVYTFVLALLSQLTEFYLDHVEVFSLLFFILVVKIISFKKRRYIDG